MPGKCLTETVVYKATITTQTSTKTYIGSTQNTFKQRYYAHKADITKPQNRCNTTLANHVWTCKGETPQIKWEIYCPA